MKCIKKLHILHLPLWFTFLSLIFICIFTRLTQWNYEPCRVRPPKLDRSWWRVLMKYWRREWQTTSVLLPWESQEQHEKAKRYDGQGSLVCCSPWDNKESDKTEWLNWTYISETIFHTDYKHNLCEIYLYFTYILHTYIYNYL